MADQTTPTQGKQNVGQAGRTEQQSSGTQLTPVQDMADYLREYAKEKPEMAALWCLGIGFVLGWKLKPW